MYFCVKWETQRDDEKKQMNEIRNNEILRAITRSKCQLWVYSLLVWRKTKKKEFSTISASHDQVMSNNKFVCIIFFSLCMILPDLSVLSSSSSIYLSLSPFRCHVPYYPSVFSYSDLLILHSFLFFFSIFRFVFFGSRDKCLLYQYFFTDFLPLSHFKLHTEQRQHPQPGYFCFLMKCKKKKGNTKKNWIRFIVVWSILKWYLSCGSSLFVMSYIKHITHS